MIPWILLLGTAALLGLCAIFYLITRVRRFSFLGRLAEKHRALSWLIAIAAVASLFLLWSVNLYAVVIAVLYTALIWLLCDLAAWIVRRIRKTEPKRYWAGAAAVALSAILLISGWIAAHRVRRTHYEVQTDRIEAPLRIALIADSHLGVTLDGAAFAKELRRIEAEQLADRHHLEAAFLQLLFPFHFTDNSLCRFQGNGIDGFLTSRVVCRSEMHHQQSIMFLCPAGCRTQEH